MFSSLRLGSQLPPKVQPAENDTTEPTAKRQKTHLTNDDKDEDDDDDPITHFGEEENETDNDSDNEFES